MELFYKHNLNNEQVDPNVHDSQSESRNNDNREGDNKENDDINIDPDEELDILKEFYNEKRNEPKKKVVYILHISNIYIQCMIMHRQVHFPQRTAKKRNALERSVSARPTGKNSETQFPRRRLTYGKHLM